MCRPRRAECRAGRLTARTYGVEARTRPTPPGVWVWDSRGWGGPAPRTVARDGDDNRRSGGLRAQLRVPYSRRTSAPTTRSHRLAIMRVEEPRLAAPATRRR